jgi:hypothetical protein
MILRAQMKVTPAEAIPAYDSPAPTGETLTGEVRDSEERPKSEHIRIRVTSKHLILASHYFRSMLRVILKRVWTFALQKLQKSRLLKIILLHC